MPKYPAKPSKNKPKPKPKPKPKYTPSDYLRGSKTVGESYTAWDTYGQGKPDFGKGAGPGEPYREVQRRVRKPPAWTKPKTPTQGVKPSSGRIAAPGWIGKSISGSSDPRVSAIRKRLGWS